MGIVASPLKPENKSTSSLYFTSLKRQYKREWACQGGNEYCLPNPSGTFSFNGYTHASMT